jgi:hypothetical protein
MPFRSIIAALRDGVLLGATVLRIRELIGYVICGTVCSMRCLLRTTLDAEDDAQMSAPAHNLSDPLPHTQKLTRSVTHYVGSLDRSISQVWDLLVTT